VYLRIPGVVYTRLISLRTNLFRKKIIQAISALLLLLMLSNQALRLA
jgi:hypothetical protein